MNESFRGNPGVETQIVKLREKEDKNINTISVLVSRQCKAAVEGDVGVCVCVCQ